MHLGQIDDEVDIIVLPEMFNTGFLVEPQQMPADAHDKAVKWLRKHAASKQAVVCASLIVQQGKRYYNRLHWVHPDGNIQYYDKRHLFSYGQEDRYFEAGTQPLIVECKGWRIKPLICYDLRFPVWAKNSLQADGRYAYDMLIYIANWPSSRIGAWQSLLYARAIENQAYALGVNRVGDDAQGTAHNGSSLLIDAKGNKLSDDVADGQESVQRYSLQYDELQAFRDKFPLGLDWDTFKIE